MCCRPDATRYTASGCSRRTVTPNSGVWSSTWGSGAEALVERAERWAVANGYTELRLRSGLQRSEAHRFYAHIGYDLAKTSHMFRKVVT